MERRKTEEGRRRVRIRRVRFRRSVLAAFLLPSSVFLLAAQGPAAPTQRRTITATTTAILVDAVVRDKTGRLVTDLNATDFEVFEDGVPQTVDSFTRVSHGGGIGIGVAWRAPDRTIAVNPTEKPEATASPSSAPLEDAATVALVFDHLSSESLALAQKATLAYVPLSGDSPVRVGVFAGDIGVRVLQFYTNDRAAVRRAIAQITPTG
jgi:VWFA-related protein